MIRLKFLLGAESVIRDSQTGLISAINIFTDFSPVGFPALIYRLSTLALFTRDDGDPNVLVYLLKIFLDEQNLHEQEISVNFQDKHRMNSIVVFSGLPIPQPGMLRFEIWMENTSIGQFTITVNPVKVVTEIKQEA